ncbi:hypothetical protein C8Q74DRAFT_232190 [Fomes fomentarius]|nr:hypothetical protein C8Q74DRAFT_232190 [Fomes fomentarius]
MLSHINRIALFIFPPPPICSTRTAAPIHEVDPALYKQKIDEHEEKEDTSTLQQNLGYLVGWRADSYLYLTTPGLALAGRSSVGLPRGRFYSIFARRIVYYLPPAFPLPLCYHPMWHSGFLGPVYVVGLAPLFCVYNRNAYPTPHLPLIPIPLVIRWDPRHLRVFTRLSWTSVHIWQMSSCSLFRLPPPIPLPVSAPASGAMSYLRSPGRWRAYHTTPLRRSLPDLSICPIIDNVEM